MEETPSPCTTGRPVHLLMCPLSQLHHCHTISLVWTPTLHTRSLFLLEPVWNLPTALKYWNTPYLKVCIYDFTPLALYMYTALCMHTAPGLDTPTPFSSTSINVQWSPPPNSDRLPLTYHFNYTGMSRSTSDTTLTLTGLHPYEEYTISVQAGNKGGLSVPVTGTARTYSDSELVV